MKSKKIFIVCGLIAATILFFSVNQYMNGAQVPEAPETEAHAVSERQDHALLGVFSMEREGKWSELLRVESEGGEYYVSLKRMEGWARDKTPLAEMTDEQYQELMKSPPAAPFSGLVGKGIVLMRVAPGFSLKGFTTSTGYFAILPFGPLELSKT